MEIVSILPPFIKLEQFLKLCGAADTGGMAKRIIADGSIKVDGEICTMRGKKLKGGEKIEFDNKAYFCRIKEKNDN